MDNLLKYPQSTIVDRIVHKTKFYEFMEVNPRMKAHFVNDVTSITWLYKLSTSSLHVADSDDMKEIEVFVASLKQPDCPTDLFTFIDTNMPHHIVFILLYEDSAMLLVNYKEWTDGSHSKFRITQAFATPWMPVGALHLEVQGQSLPRIYDNFVAQVSGIGEHQAGTLSEIVKLRQTIAKAETDLQKLQKKMRKEPQYDMQVRINCQVKTKRQELAELKQKMEELSV